MQKNKAAGKEKSIFGFTLLEIMIVVAVIGLLAAIAIPNMIRMRMTANEGSAEATLKTMVTAMESYRAAQSTPAFPTQFDSLTSPTSPPSYLEATLTNPTTFDKSGYRFQLMSTGTNTYLVHGSPVTANQTGKNYFCADQSGEVQKSDVSFMTDQTRCREVCGAGEDYDSSSDVCHADCTGGTSWNSETSSCACPSGEESDGTICHASCPEGETWNSEEAECEADSEGECPSGQTMVTLQCPGGADPSIQCLPECEEGLVHHAYGGGNCASTDCSTAYGAGSPYFSTFVDGCGCWGQNCATGLVNDGSGNCVPDCAASGGQEWNGSACACPSGESWDSAYNICHVTCGDGQSWDGDSCECPYPGPGWNGSACACPSGESWSSNNNTCHITCTGGKTWDGDSCECPSPGPGWNGSACACPSGQTWDSNCNTCYACGSARTWNNASCGCFCSGDQAIYDATCDVCYQCGQYQTFNNSTCVCEYPSCSGGRTFNGGTGQCECPSGQEWDGDECHLPCVWNATWDGSTCACPSNYGSDGNQGCVCVLESCPEGTTLIEGGCRCE